MILNTLKKNKYQIRHRLTLSFNGIVHISKKQKVPEVFPENVLAVWPLRFRHLNPMFPSPSLYILYPLISSILWFFVIPIGQTGQSLIHGVLPWQGGTQVFTIGTGFAWCLKGSFSSFGSSLIATPTLQNHSISYKMIDICLIYILKNILLIFDRANEYVESITVKIEFIILPNNKKLIL